MTDAFSFEKEGDKQKTGGLWMIRDPYDSREDGVKGNAHLNRLIGAS